MTRTHLLPRLSVVASIGALTALLGAPGAAQAQYISLIGVGEVPGTLSDGLELVPPLLEDGVTPHDQVGGFGSAITYTGVGNRYLAVPDRGPADGATSYLDRYYMFDIKLAPGATPAVSVSLSQATLLTNDLGELLTGSAAAFDATNSPAGRRFDPEGIVMSGKGTFFVSDEYGPFIYELGAGGDRHKVKPVPPRFLISTPGTTPATELPPFNTSGRQANRGMEGLAISPDGKKLYGLMQNALIQDGALDSKNGRIGMNVRLLELDLESHQTRELVYVLQDARNGLCEILAIDDHQFLVLERDGTAGAKAASKRIYKIDISAASDVSQVDALPTGALPAGVVPVAKTLFLDLLDPAFGLAGAAFPEKIEGLAFGPPLADGRLSLLVTSDNDFKSAQPSQVFAFAVDPAALSGFTRQELQVDVALQALFPQPVLAPGAAGYVQVTISGSHLLPVSALDARSVRVAGAAPATLLGRPLCRTSDADQDGQSDLLCLVDQASMKVEPRAREITLSGRTTTGTRVRGTVSYRRRR